MRLCLTEDAASDLEGIKRHTENIDAALAERTLDHIGQILSVLRRLPHLGHDGMKPGSFEMVVPRLPIVIVYRIDRAHREEALIVLRVYHTRRDRTSNAL